MTKINLNISKYDIAMNEFIEKVVDGFTRLDPLLGQMQTIHSFHRGTIRNVRIPIPLDQGFFPIEVQIDIKKGVFKETLFEEFTDFIVKIADQKNSEFKTKMLTGLQEVTRVTGNQIDGKGRPFSWDLYNELLEKTHIEFDEKGSPQRLSLIMAPEMYEKIKDINPTDEQKEKAEEIINQKRKEYYAQKRTRRLS